MSYKTTIKTFVEDTSREIPTMDEEGLSTTYHPLSAVFNPVDVEVHTWGAVDAFGAMALCWYDGSDNLSTLQEKPWVKDGVFPGYETVAINAGFYPINSSHLSVESASSAK